MNAVDCSAKSKRKLTFNTGKRLCWFVFNVLILPLRGVKLKILWPSMRAFIARNDNKINENRESILGDAYRHALIKCMYFTSSPQGDETQVPQKRPRGRLV